MARILIVDDDELVLIALRELLRSENYEVHTFSRGSEALKKLDQEIFDLVVLDIVMPEMDGFELCQKIRGKETLRKTPIIFLTAKNQEEEHVSCQVHDASVDKHRRKKLPNRALHDENIHLSVK